MDATYLPVTATVPRTSQRSCNRPKSHMRSLALVLGAKLVTSLLCEASIPCCCDGQACRENRSIVGLTNCQWTILEAETSKVEARDRSDLFECEWPPVNFKTVSNTYVSNTRAFSTSN